MYSRIKLSARLALNGAYLKMLPILTMIIFTVFVFLVCNPILDMFVDRNDVFFVFSFLSLVFFVLIVSPARLHLETKHFMLARGMKNLRVRTGASGFAKSLVFYPLIFCIKLFWFAVFEAIPVLSAILFYYYLNENSLSLKAFVVICIGIVCVFIIGLAFYSVFIQRYSKAAFYLSCYDDFSAFDAIRESVRKTRDSLVDILLFKLGFVPWFLLCIGIVPMLFVIPYYKQSLTFYHLK
mgnify:CR=1 FL=1